MIVELRAQGLGAYLISTGKAKGPVPTRAEVSLA